MKRIGNLYSKIYDMDNLIKADKKAQLSKSKQMGVIIHNRNKEQNLLSLQRMLINKTYKTSEYKTFKIIEKKEREVFRLPFFPDRICHHAIINVLEPYFVSHFTSDTYACIKGKGIHAALNKLKLALRDKEGTKYCLKIDVKKFYPNVNNEMLKQLLRRKFKDKDLLWLLDEIVGSTIGLPIGNLCSQVLANYYLSFFDHWIKETKGVKYYFRYCDDMVILSDGKQELHSLLADIKTYLFKNLKLEVKENYQIFPVESRGIDFVGYVSYHTHVQLRKTIKQNFARKLAKGASKETIASYRGWTKHADCRNLEKKLLNHDTFFRTKHSSNRTRICGQEN